MTTLILILQLVVIAAVVAMVAGWILAIVEKNSAGSGYSESARQAQRDVAELIRRANK